MYFIGLIVSLPKFMCHIHNLQYFWLYLEIVFIEVIKLKWGYWGGP